MCEKEEVIIEDAPEAMFLNYIRRGGTLEIRFSGSIKFPYYVFTEVENIQSLREEYAAAQEAINLAVDIATMGYENLQSRRS